MTLIFAVGPQACEVMNFKLPASADALSGLSDTAQKSTGVSKRGKPSVALGESSTELDSITLINGSCAEAFPLILSASQLHNSNIHTGT